MQRLLIIPYAVSVFAAVGQLYTSYVMKLLRGRMTIADWFEITRRLNYCVQSFVEDLKCPFRRAVRRLLCGWPSDPCLVDVEFASCSGFGRVLCPRHLSSNGEV